MPAPSPASTVIGLNPDGSIQWPATRRRHHGDAQHPRPPGRAAGHRSHGLAAALLGRPHPAGPGHAAICPVVVVTRQIHSPAGGIRYFALVAAIGLILAALVAAALARRFTRPLAAAVAATRRIASGDLDAKVAPRPERGPGIRPTGRIDQHHGGQSGPGPGPGAAVPPVGLPRAADAADLDPGLRRRGDRRGHRRPDGGRPGHQRRSGPARAAGPGPARPGPAGCRPLLPRPRDGRLLRRGPAGGRRIPAPGRRARARTDRRPRVRRPAVGACRRRPARPDHGQPPGERGLLRRRTGWWWAWGRRPAGRRRGWPTTGRASRRTSWPRSSSVISSPTGSAGGGRGRASVWPSCPNWPPHGSLRAGRVPVVDGRGTRMVVWLRPPHLPDDPEPTAGADLPPASGEPPDPTPASTETTGRK